MNARLGLTYHNAQREPVSGRKTVSWQQPGEVAKLTVTDEVVLAEELPMTKGACGACCRTHAGLVPCIVVVPGILQGSSGRPLMTFQKHHNVEGPVHHTCE